MTNETNDPAISQRLKELRSGCYHHRIAYQRDCHWCNPPPKPEKPKDKKRK